VIHRLIAWWKRDLRMARRATEAAIRQEMDTHPVDKGEYWRNNYRHAAGVGILVSTMSAHSAASPYARVVRSSSDPEAGCQTRLDSE